jgi:hypothetical protein
MNHFGTAGAVTIQAAQEIGRREQKNMRVEVRGFSPFSTEDAKGRRHGKDTEKDSISL